MSKKPPKEKPAADAADTPVDGAEGAEGEAPAKKKPPMMLIVGALAAVLVLGGGGAGAYFVFLKPKPAAAGKQLAKVEKPKKKAADKGGEGGKPDPNGPTTRDGPDGVVFYTLPEMVVNMQASDGRPTFLKLKLTLELPDGSVADELTPNMPRLQDMFQSFLRELRPEDLSGSQGSYQLRMELLRRVSLVAAPAKVNAVLIEEMLIS